MKNRANEFRSAKEAVRKAASRSGHSAILLAGQRLVVPTAEARLLEISGTEFAYLFIDKKTGRVVTVPVSPKDYRETPMKPKTVRTIGCPACSAKRGTPTKVSGVYTCAKCGGIFGTCYKGDSHSLVLPYFAKESVDPKTLRYFDLTTLGSDGVHRVHGWFDPSTKLVHQVG